MRKINILLVLLLLLVSVGAVSAADDLNDTIASDDEAVDGLAVSDEIVHDDSNDKEVLTSASHTVNSSNYNKYFSSGGELVSKDVKSGDTINIEGNFTKKNFIFKIPVNIVGSQSNNLKNCIFTLYADASGSTVSNLNIANTIDYTYGIFLNGASNCLITGCTIINTGASSYTVCVGNNANHNNVTDNRLTAYGLTYGHGTRSTSPVIISGAHYNYIANNMIECDDANAIYLSSYSGGPLNGGNSNFNVIYNNAIKYNVLPTSWSYGIQIMGTDNVIDSNTVIGAYRGVSTSGARNVIVNNKIINITGADFNNPGVEAGGETAIVASSNAIVANNTILNARLSSSSSGISALDGSVIENNIVQVLGGSGIHPQGSNIIIKNNNISTVSGAGVLINTFSFNLTVVSNTISSRSGVGVLVQKLSSKKMPGNLTITNNFITTGNYYAIDARDADSSTNNVLSPNRGNGAVGTPEGEYDASKPIYDFNGTTYVINASNYDNYISDNGYLNSNISDGDILYFEGEFSNKTIFINSGVKITGKNPMFYNVKFKVYSDGVWIENLTIKNDKVSNGWGVLVYRAFGATITNCDIEVYDNNAAYAIYVVESSDVDVINNKLTSSGNYLTYTILAHTVEDCRFINNTIYTFGTSEAYINGGEVCVDGNETCADGSENCVDGTENCLDGTENCLDGTENCVDGSENCVDGSENCVDGSENCLDGDESCTDGSEVCTSGSSFEGNHVLKEVYRTYGILMAYSSNNIVSGNKLFTTSKLNQTLSPTASTNSIVGIDLYYNTHNNIISDNEVTVYGMDNYIYGVGVLGYYTGHDAPEGQGATNNQFINNVIVLNGTYCVEGIIIGDESENTTISGNIVDARCANVSYGINLEMSQNSAIRDNAFTLNSDIVYGIEVYGSNDNMIYGNDFEINAKQAYGFILNNGAHNNIHFNVIFMNVTGDEINYKNFDSLGTGSCGIYLKSNSSDNSIAENNITSLKGYAVVIDVIAVNNNVVDNYLDSEMGIGNSAVNGSANNNVKDNYKYLVVGKLEDIVIKYLENGTVIFTTADENLEGATVEFIIADENYGSAVVNNKTAELKFKCDFTPADYLISAIVSKDNFKVTEFTSGLQVLDGDLMVTVDNTTGAIYRNAKFVATVKDIWGNPVKGIAVEFYVMDDGYPAYLGKAISDNDGLATLTAEIPQIYSDNPTILADIKDPMYFNSISASANLNYYKLNSTSISINSKVYPAGILAILKDQNGNPLNNKKVHLMIGSANYDVVSNSKGEIALPSLNRGSYSVYASFAGDDSYYSSNNNSKVTVMPAITGNKDKTVYYGNTITYKLRIVGSNGKYVGAGKVVTVKVNENTYELKTDKNGYVTKAIKLNAGSYTVTAQFNGDKVSNKLTFKPTLIAKDISKKKAKVVKFSTKLVNKNGKILKNKVVAFKINGKTYKAKTNKKGVATASIKNLKVGKFTIYSSYGGCKISNKITIKK